MTSEPDDVTADFIFGTLATDDLRLAQIRGERLGLSHRNVTAPAIPRSDEPVTITVMVGPDTAVDQLVARYSIDGSFPDEGAGAVALHRVATEWDTLVWGYRERWQGTIPAQPAGTLVSYRLEATAPDGSVSFVPADPEDPSADLFAWYVDVPSIPDWLRDAVIYQVFVDRFDPGLGREWLEPESLNGFSGGTIRGVIDRLPYLTELGITCLWLSPVFPSPSHHGYDATDYASVEPRLGSDADLDELFVAAHDHGIRVILDFVANHLSSEHPAFRKAASSPDDPYRSWFTFDADGCYRSFFGVESMPRIRTDDPGARRYLIEAAVGWLRRGADGFRLDYANGPSHAFWATFRQATRRARPDSITIGEVVETAELQRSYAGRLDGTLDFLLLQQIRSFFAFDLISPTQFDAFLSRHLTWFREDISLPSFIDNHDMNRFLWVAGGDIRRLRLAALCQFTLPHPPIIYYGTEVALRQWHDLEYPDGSRRMEESRVPMVWDDRQDGDTLAFFRQLVRLRQGAGALWRGERQPLIRSEDGLYVVLIRGSDGHAAFVALNRGGNPQRFELPPWWHRTLERLASSEHVRIGGHTIELPAWAGLVLIGDVGAVRSGEIDAEDDGLPAR